MRLPLDRLQQQYVVRCERNAAEAFGCTQRARDAVARRSVATEGGDRVPAADQTVPHLRSLHPLVVPPARDLAHDLMSPHGACRPPRKSDLLKRYPKHFEIEERGAPGSSSKAIYVRKPPK